MAHAIQNFSFLKNVETIFKNKRIVVSKFLIEWQNRTNAVSFEKFLRELHCGFFTFLFFLSSCVLSLIFSLFYVDFFYVDCWDTNRIIQNVWFLHFFFLIFFSFSSPTHFSLLFSSLLFSPLFRFSLFTLLPLFIF